MNKTKILVVNDTSATTHYGCELVMSYLHNTINKFSDKVIEFVPTGSLVDWSRFSFEEFSHVLVNGEGSIHSGNRRAINLIDCLYYAKNSFCKVALLNASVFNCDDDLLKRITNIDLIVCREKTSFNILKALGLKPKLSIDFSFYGLQERYSTVYRTELNDRIVYFDSVIPQCSLDLKKVAKKNNSNIVTLHYWNEFSFSLLKTFITNRSGFKVFIKSNVIEKILYGVSLFLRSKYKNDFVIEKFYNNRIITGRFHAVCIALFFGSPLKYIDSNTDKIRSIISTIFDDSNIYNSFRFSGLGINEDFYDYDYLFVRRRILDFKKEFEHDFSLFFSDV